VALALALAWSGACRRAPASGEPHFKQGQADAAAGNFSEAVNRFRNALAVEPRNGQYVLALADAYARSGEADRAGNAYELAAELLPERTDVQLEVAKLMLLDGKYDAAKLRLDEVLKREPRNVEALTLRASALAGLRDLDTAIADTETALRALPDESELLASLGTLHLMKGEREEGEAALRKALEIDPRSYTALVALANYTWLAGKSAEAEDTVVTKLSARTFGDRAIRVERAKPRSPER
jgi:Flp pilus assembly protein TadD